MNIPTLLSESNVQALGWMLVHFVWQGLAVAAVLAMAKTLTTSPRVRYAMACAALLAMVSLPLGTLLAHSAGAAPSSFAVSGLVGEGAVPGASMAVTGSGGTNAGAEFPLVIPNYRDWSTGRAGGLQEHMPVIVSCWGVGVLLLSLRLLGGGWVSRRLRRAGTSPLPVAWQRRVRTLAERQGLRHGVEVLTSTVASIPMVVGLFRPVVLIPASTFLGLSHQQLEAILQHELAHVRRYDNLVNLLQRLVETVLFFHPAVWWVSNSIRVEREYCCDDAAVAGGNPKAYAAALATLEEMRTPVLAAAATGGPLLARVRRLLVAEGGKDGLANTSAASLAGLLAALVLAGVLVEGIQADEPKGAKGDEAMSVMVDVTPTQPTDGTTLVSTVGPLMRVVDQPQWSSVRLQGVMGHAFQFEMKEGGHWVYHDNMDWGLALDVLYDIANFREFHATKEDAEVDLPALKREAMEAVRASLERGVPALVWQPMSLEQKADGHSGYCWGLIVGYNEGAETYTVRHPFVSEQYTVRYDAIGHADPAEWFNIRIFEQLSGAEEEALHRTALQNALAFAQGTRHNGGGGPVRGFAAYELWRAAFESEDIETKAAHHHITMLRTRRRVAATYLRELRDIFPAAAEPLAAAAAEYDREMEALEPLHALITAARSVNGFTAEDRAEVGRLIDAALKAERAAVAQVEAAVALVGKG